MLENCRTLSLLANFFKICTPKRFVVNKFFSVFANENSKDQLADSNNSLENKDKKASNEIIQDGFHKIRFRFPEFLPNPKVEYRNAIKEKLERRDMLRRRNILNIPNFYVGSILAVTSSDKHATGKLTRFVGICIFKINDGLRSEFILRNVLEHLGVEVRYSLYSPLIQQIEVLRLEKRLDENLFYLRDAPNEYSTFPVDMVKEYQSEQNGVPVNTIKVPLNPGPWPQKYERMNLKGVILPEISEKRKRQMVERAEPWKKFDLMDIYRQTIPEEDQKEIYLEICDELEKLEAKGKFERRKKMFIKPPKQKLF